MSKENLYDKKSFFKLFIYGSEHDIIEPVNWDKISINLPRDKDSFAFNFEFIDDEIQLGFADDDISFDLIEGVYDQYGSDGVVELRYGYYTPYTNTMNIQYVGNINLNTRSRSDDGHTVTCSVEKTSFENLLRTRFETNVTLNSNKTLDGEVMSAPIQYDVRLHSKTINKQMKAVISEPKSYISEALARYMNLQLDTSVEVVSELQENEALPLGVSGIDPRDQERYFFKIKEVGSYTLKAKYNFNLKILSVNGIVSYNICPRIIIMRAGNTIEYLNIEQFRQNQDFPGGFAELVFNNEFEITRDFQINDVIYLDIFGLMGKAGRTYNYVIDNYTSTIEMLGQTTAIATTTKAYRLFDAINKGIESVSGNKDALISSILSEGGALYKTFIMNGYAIRKFTTTDKPIIINLKDTITGICNQSGLGFGYTKKDGKDFFVIEPVEYFFQNKEIAFVEFTSDYREEHAKELVYNEIELGYDKFPEDESNSLDEFNTYQASLTPIKTYKSKFERKCKMITSGYAIETIRREQFNENPSSSIANDDEIFMISCFENFTQTASYYATSPASNEMGFTRKMNLEPGSTFKIIGGNNQSNEGKTFTVVSKSPIEEKYIVSGAVVNLDNGNVLLQKNITGIEAERDQLFDLVTGLLSPETSYNIRFSPERIKYNWANYLNIGFSKKLNDELIKTTFVKNNDKMVSLLSILDVNRRKEPVVAFAEKEDTNLGIYRANGKQALHLPVFSYFKADISYDDFNFIKERLTGSSDSENNYGWIYFYDDKGILIKGYVYSVKYQPAEEIAEFQVGKIGNY